MLALANTAEGISDNNGLGNTIGGTADGAGNLISGNGAQGIVLSAASGDLIAGNVIGTTPGTITDGPGHFHPLGNGGDGILVTATSSNNTIGGHGPGAGNLVVRNQNYGVEISIESDFNVVSGNAIGTTLAAGNEIGTGPPVNLGNFQYGISVTDSSGNTIGGVTQVNSQGQISQFGGNSGFGQRTDWYLDCRQRSLPSFG